MAASAAPFAADTNSATASTAIAAHVTPTGASQPKRTGLVNRILLDGTNQDAYQIILIMGAILFGMLFELIHQKPSLFQQVVEAPAWYRWGVGFPFLCAPLIPLALCPAFSRIVAAFSITECCSRIRCPLRRHNLPIDSRVDMVHYHHLALY